MTDPIIPRPHVHRVCRIGQAKLCCRYLTCGANGFNCEKRSSLKQIIDSRVAAGTFHACGDNCDGNPESWGPETDA